MLSYKSRAVWQWTWKGVMIAAGVSLVSPSFAATDIPLTVTMSEAVTVTGTPRVAVDVGGQTRYATYTSGSTTSALTFTLSPTLGDLDLDGIAVSSPIDLNGGTIKDAAGNNATLTFAPPDTSGIKVNYPSLSMDFVADADGRFTLSGTVYNDFTSFLTAAGGSFSRASTATYIDSAGVMQTAAANAARFDYDPQTLAPKGLLIEEARTNYVRNGQAQGGGVGVSPTNWAISAGTGATAQIIAVGAEYGMNYIDVQVNGTPSMSPNLTVLFDTATSTPSVLGNVWTVSAAFKRIGGDFTNVISCTLRVFEINSGGGYLTTGVGSDISSMPTSGAPQRYSYSYTPSNASLAYVRPTFACSGSGAPVSYTVRIYAPQLEKAKYATSYIPTTSGTLSRTVDSLIVPTGAWFNATEGSLFLQADTYSSGATAQAQGIAIHAVGNNGYLFYKQGSSSGLYSFAGTVNASLGNVSANSTFKTSLSYNATTARGALNNVLSSSFTPASVVTPTRLDNGQAGQWNGHISKFRYYPLMPTPTQLQALTQ